VIDDIDGNILDGLESTAPVEYRPRPSPSEPPFIAAAAEVEPFEERKRPRPKRRRQARRALALALLGVVCFGFVFGALAVIAGRRAILDAVAASSAPHHVDCHLAYTAIAIARAGMALHLTIAIAIMPWVLFMLPFLRAI
jgi:hypothetical protein